MDLPDSPSLMLRVNKIKLSETVMGLMFCILLLVILVNSGVYEVGFEVWALAELLVMWSVVVYWCYWFVNIWRQISWKCQCCCFQPPKKLFPIKTTGVYYMHRNTFQIVLFCLLLRSKEDYPCHRDERNH